MNSVKIISYNGVSEAGGVERVAYYLNELLTQAGYSVEIIDENYIKNLKIYKFLEKMNIRVVRILYPLLLSINFFLMREKSIVISNGYNLGFYKSDILFIHGTMKGFFIKTKLKKSLADRLLIFYEKIACIRAKKIICVSENVKIEAMIYYCKNKEKYKVLNNCIGNNIFYIKKKNKSSILNIGFCGRLDENKGVKSLLLLAKEIEDKDIKLNIATNNSKNIDLFKRFKNVNLEVGLKLEQLNKFYNRNDVMFFPSDYEGFEMVTLEAIACGVPIYGKDVGAISQLKNEINSIILMSNDPNNWIYDLKKLKESITDIEKNKNSLYIKNIYGKERYLEKLIKILNQ